MQFLSNNDGMRLFGSDWIALAVAGVCIMLEYQSLPKPVASLSLEVGMKRRHAFGGHVEMHIIVLAKSESLSRCA